MISEQVIAILSYLAAILDAILDLLMTGVLVDILTGLIALIDPLNPGVDTRIITLGWIVVML